MENPINEKNNNKHNNNNNEKKKKKSQELININIVADFLYGKTTNDMLWNYLDSNKENKISIERLQLLFYALFIFAIQLESTNTNLHPYINECQKLALEYAINFSNNIQQQINNS